MKILISGSSGLVGTAVATALMRDGHGVARLVRRRTPPAKLPGLKDVGWDPTRDEFDAEEAEGADAVIHLAGASIASGRWYKRRKRLLRSSRVDATRHLVEALGHLSRPPRIFIAASAIGYYGDRGEEKLIEMSGPGTDFLALLARDWEMESGRASEFGARAAFLRFGVILARHGGALQRMLLPFRLGLGGRLGAGRQWMSWLTLGEAVGIVRFALESSPVRGPVNAVAPHPARNAEFTRALGRALGRPTLFPVPGAMLRLLLGEMADALLLASQRVLPDKLRDLGYRFLHPDLEPALAAALKKE